MCLVSKRVKQKALKTSQKQLRYEYMDCEEKCKFYSFTANHKALKEELKNRKFLMNVIKYQNSKRYVNKQKTIK